MNALGSGGSVEQDSYSGKQEDDGEGRRNLEQEFPQMAGGGEWANWIYLEKDYPNINAGSLHRKSATGCFAAT